MRTYVNFDVLDPRRRFHPVERDIEDPLKLSSSVSREPEIDRWGSGNIYVHFIDQSDESFHNQVYF